MIYIIEKIVNIVGFFFKIFYYCGKGISYCFLKKPSILKYFGLIITITAGIYTVVKTAKDFGILGLFAGMIFPLIYLSIMGKISNCSSSKTYYNSLPGIEQEFLFQELMKDKNFKEDIINDFVKRREEEYKTNKQSEKIIELKSIEDTEDKNDFLYRDYLNGNNDFKKQEGTGNG